MLASSRPPVDRRTVLEQTPEPYMVVSFDVLAQENPMRLHAVSATSILDAMNQVAQHQCVMAIGALPITDWMARGAAVVTDNPLLPAELRGHRPRMALYREAHHLLAVCRSQAEVIRATFPDQQHTLLRELAEIEGRIACESARPS